MIHSIYLDLIGFVLSFLIILNIMKNHKKNTLASFSKSLGLGFELFLMMIRGASTVDAELDSTNPAGSRAPSSPIRRGNKSVIEHFLATEERLPNSIVSSPTHNEKTHRHVRTP